MSIFTTMTRTTTTLALASGLAFTGCEPAEETTEAPELSPESVELAAGKTDGARAPVIRKHRGQALVDLYGDTAHSVAQVLREGGLTTFTRGAVDYVRGAYVLCATAGDQAACRMLTGAAEDKGDGVLEVHGARFRSGASELFGALAGAQGVDPRSTHVVEQGGVACGKNARAVWCRVEPGADEMAVLEVNFENLGDLGPDYVYEGWLITEEGPIAAGRFNLTEDLMGASVEVDRATLAAASMYVLTIEPRVGDDPAPSDTHVVAGVFDEIGVAALSYDHPAALGDDFADISGDYILETPTSADVAEDYDQGVWFVVPGQGAGLDLPELPAGWVYEGWVVGDEGPISTGRFLDPMASDFDGAGDAAGPDSAPPFPGQDFIDPAMSLVGGAVVISVEPEPDNSPAPFFFKPLVDMAAEDLGAGVPQSMDDRVKETAPTGTALRRL